MLSAEDNERLVRTGPGTPMGNLFRQFWLPVCLSAEIGEPDGAPVRVKILGEELLAFRDSAGRPGLVEPRCAHRGADLWFGRNEHGGLRCVYHGWKFAVDGQCIEAPTLDAEQFARVADRARIRAYPARDWGDMVWAYLGPQPAPEPPDMEVALVPRAHRHVSKKLQECNWAQAVEGSVDTAHFSFLHMPVLSESETLESRVTSTVRGYSARTMGADHIRWMRDDPRPRYSIARHDAGMAMGGARTADDGKLYWRIAQFLMPAHAYTPSAVHGENYHGQTFVPIDDESCWIYVFSWNPVRPVTDTERESYRKGGAVYAVVDEHYVPVRNRANHYLLDRKVQKSTNYTGVIGVSEQDQAIQDSQGRIHDRTRELLGPTDIGVVQFRRMMLDAARSLEEGTRPVAALNPAAYRVRGGGAVLPETMDFAAVMRERFGNETGLVKD